MKKVIILIGVIVGLIVLSNIQYDNAVQECIKKGNSSFVCESGLR